MSYWSATRHPAPCLFFVLPLLIVYEYGVISIGGAQSYAVRNGADVWLRSMLASTGFTSPWLAPLLVFLVLFIWAFRHRHNPPGELPSTVIGMALESIAYGLFFWTLSRMFGPMLESLGIRLATPGIKSATVTPLSQTITFIGAGVYEEVIFRLAIFSGGVMLLTYAGFPWLMATTIAALGSAFAFAAVHHVGINGEIVNAYVFSFRFLAGMVFTGLFLWRGFGITVGAHAIYDILVGVPL
jgi:hypothetical protein